MLSQGGLSIFLGGSLSEHVLHGIVSTDAAQLCGILCAFKETAEEVQQSCWIELWWDEREIMLYDNGGEWLNLGKTATNDDDITITTM